MKRTICIFTALFTLWLGSFGQTIKTVGTGGDYLTLRAAFDAINSRAITGAIQLQIISSITDNNAAKLYGSGQVGAITIPAGQAGAGYVTGDVVTFSTPGDPNGVAATGRVTAASGAITSIEITNPGSGYAAAPTIASTSGAGTGATPSVIIGGNYTSIDIYPTAANVVLSGAVFGSTGIIDLIGADNVTIDGSVNRTGTTTSMTIQNSQAGFTGAFTFKASNDANSNTIRYTRLLSDRSARVELTSSTNGKGVSNFLIENSFISVHANSTITTTQTGISIAGNSTNRNITIKNNEFVDLLAKGSEMLFVDNNPDILTIEGNHFYSTKTNLSLGDNSKFTIRVNSGTNVTIRGNYIGGSAKQLGGTAFQYTSTGITIASFWGIYVLSGTSIVIENNAIGNLELNIQNGTLEAIQCSSSNAIIKNNRIGDLNSSNSIITNTGFRGILVPVGPNLTVEQNSIGGIEAKGFATAVSSTSNGGGNVLNNIIGKIKLKSNGESVSQGLVAITTGSNYNIKGNYIYGCTNENPGFTFGISTASGNSVINNIIHLQASNTSIVSGITKSGIGSLTVYNNTVLIDGSSNTGNNNSHSLIETGTGAGDYRNNLLINTAANTGDATGKHYAIYLLSTPTNINYNNYYVSGTGGILGSFNNVDKTTLSAWQASTLQDCFSNSLNPNFPTPSGVATLNFLPTNQNLVATPIASITTDYLGTNRDATNPAMGALEFSVIPPASTTTTASACDSYTWTVNGTSYTQSGTYTNTIGCITYTLILTVTPSTTNTTTTSACGSYTWSVTGVTYTQTGTYSSTTGCNTEILELTITSPLTWYLDNDNDGYYTVSGVVSCTSPGAGYTSSNTLLSGDCNDNNNSINPGKSEICGNSIDDNCNGQVDEGCTVGCNFNTLSQGGWAGTGSVNPLTEIWFSAKFPSGLVIGGVSSTNRKITLTTARAVRSFLPNSGTPAKLSDNHFINPTNKTVKNTFAGQLVALVLNVANNPDLLSATISSGIYKDKTVSWLITESQKQISNSTASSSTLKSLSDACGNANLSFDNTNTGYLVCGSSSAPSTSMNSLKLQSNIVDNTNEPHKLDMQVFNNPTANLFTIKLNSNRSSAIQLRVVDFTGKVREVRSGLTNGQTVHFGSKLESGIFIAELQQEGKRVTIKLIKIN